MNILFYTPVNFRCRDIESLAKKYRENGHRIFLLSQCPPGSLQRSFKRLGAEMSSFSVSRVNALLGYFQAGNKVIQFCRQHKVDLLFSHLEPTNFISVLVQPFIASKVIIYRHHVDFARLAGFDKSITYRLTCLFAKNIISVSEAGKEFMIQHEGINPRKIEHINLGYDFSLYQAPNVAKVMAIREKYKGDILLITVGRLTQFKRTEISIEVVRRSVAQGINAILLIIGIGEKEGELRKLVRQLQLDDNVIFLGYKENILDYLSASDLLLHPSVSESSCVVVKESGLVELPVVVCKGVGDFDQYMRNGENGFVIDRDDFVDQTLRHISEWLINPSLFRILGVRLKKEILTRFSIDKVFSQYSKYSV